jgi:hypothetical protein
VKKEKEEPDDGCQEPAEKAEKPAEPESADDKPKDEKAAEAKATDDKAKDDKAKDEKAADAKPAGETRFKTLEEVKEDIRKQLAQPIAQEAKNKAVKEVLDAINEYGRRYRRWQSVKEFKKAAAEDPGKLDVASVTSKHGFQVGTTPLVDRHEVTAYDVGKNVMTFDFAALQRGDPNIMRSFADMAFGEDEPPYDAREANSSEPDVSYIYFRTAEEKAKDVTLDEVRQQVIEAWKKSRAFELAKADAEKLATKAKDAKSLAEAVGDPTKVVTPPPFSWMTTGSMAMGFGEPELGNVAGVDLAGQEFMQAVYALKAGETGVAPNQAHTKVYVVRLVGHDPSEEVLRQRFLDAGLNFQVLSIAQRERMQTTYDWYRDIEERYEVTWHRPPQAFGQRMY